MKLILVIIALFAVGCVEEEPVQEPETASSYLDWMEAHADDYIEDRQWRREQMEAALWRPELFYARKRLGGYALESGGWDLLPEQDRRSELVHPQRTSEPFDGEAISSQRPTTRDEWLALGEEVFWRMPMRAAPYLQWLSDHPELWDEVGLETNDDGTVRGLARFETARGEEAVGATCGLCHGKGGVAGRAAEDLDLGFSRSRFAAAHGVDGSAFDAWPAGTIDVTDDGVTDVVAIPDLWSVEHLTHLNASGVIKMTTPAALAVRLETQYIVGHSLESRPNRVLVWALTMYVFSLQREDSRAADEPEGRAVFERACASCHIPDAGFSGGLVAVGTINSDPLAASSGYRGTGFYKVPSLVGISDGGPFLHDNSARDLPSLLDDGHPYDIDLTEPERNALLDYLDTL